MKPIFTLILAFVFVTVAYKTFSAKVIKSSNQRYYGDDLGFE